jgi:hypothetical protein
MGTHGLLWDPDGGEVVDLNRRLASDGWNLEVAWAINDAGQIAGGGANPQSQDRGCRLTPTDPSGRPVRLGHRS